MTQSIPSSSEWKEKCIEVVKNSEYCILHDDTGGKSTSYPVIIFTNHLQLDYIFGEMPLDYRDHLTLRVTRSNDIQEIDKAQETDKTYCIIAGYDFSPFNSTINGQSLLEYIFEDPIEYTGLNDYSDYEIHPTHVTIVRNQFQSTDEMYKTFGDYWQLYTIRPTINGNYEYIYRQRKSITVEEIYKQRLYSILEQCKINCNFCDSESNTVSYTGYKQTQPIETYTVGLFCDKCNTGQNLPEHLEHHDSPPSDKLYQINAKQSAENIEQEIIKYYNKICQKYSNDKIS